MKTIEAQSTAIVATLKAKDSSTLEKETPSFYSTWDESFCGVDEPGCTMTTRSQGQQEVPKGATSILNPLQKDAKVPVPCRNCPQMPRGGKISFVVATICQIPIFFAKMLKALGLDVARVLETIATICKTKGSQPIVAKKAWVLDKQDLEGKSLEGASLYSTTIRVQTMLPNQVIERSSFTPRIVVVDNTQRLFHIDEYGSKVFTPQRVMFDSRAQALMLDKAVIEILG